MDKPQKHAKLARPSGGEWGRLEVALTGAPCAVIEQLAMQVVKQMPGYNIGFVNAAHGGDSPKETATVRFTQKGSGAEIQLNRRVSSFTRRAVFNDCDLVLVNGNHFAAEQQILLLYPEQSFQPSGILNTGPDVVIPTRPKRPPSFGGGQGEAAGALLTNVRLVIAASADMLVPEHMQPVVEGVPRLLLEDLNGIVGFFQNLLLESLTPLNGLLLAGGNSLRMGSDKSLLTYHGKPQRAHVFELLQPLCRDVFISCNAAQAPTIDLPKIEDRFLGAGPVGGILSAFQYAPDAAWLTVATDLPYLSRTTLNYLLAHRNPSRLATAFIGHAAKPEPLLTIWEPRAYPVLLHALAMGVTCPRNVLMQSDVELLHPPDAGELQNVNFPAERDAALTAVHPQLHSR